MYLDYFGLTKEPFSLTPDPKFIYFSKQHQEAVAALKYGIESRKGFLLLCGEIGTGKTTICRELLNQLDNKTDISIVLNPLFSTAGLLRAINRDFGNNNSDINKDDQLDSLHNFVISRAHDGHNAVVIIDEAQNLTRESLETVRLISNFETDTKKLVQIILVGQPELEKSLKSYDLRQLDQRISIRERLGKLSFAEFKKYLAHRLFVAGSRGNIKFSTHALKLIYRYASGYPRLGNHLCDRLLLAAFAQDTRLIKAKLVQESINDLQGRPKVSTWWRVWACQ